jgi:penicillin-binding protein 1C
MDKLKKFGFTTFKNSSDYYGLSLILGGGETSLWELSSAYAGFSRCLNNFNSHQKYYGENFDKPSLLKSNMPKILTSQEAPIEAGAIWLTFQALLKVNRPASEAGWEYFQSSRHVAWKTGTSFGFRDAWAIATTPDYVVGVWAGNSNGEGRPGLTGITAAAPLLFNILNLLPNSPPHEEPDGEITYAEVCSQSGYRIGKNCKDGKMMAIPSKGLRTGPCPYCQSIKSKRVSNSKDKEMNVLDGIKVESWFVLPPAMEFFYKRYHPSYLSVPVNTVNEETDIPEMEFIYPGANDRIYIPKTIEGKSGNVIFEVAHRENDIKIFWHLDQQFIGTTRYIHQMPLTPTPGQHLITLTDEHGYTLKRRFTILNSLSEKKGTNDN